ncbi:MAG: hypothetical protein ACOYKD_10410 [Anaerolineaceae bacterium]|jgi:hypothetical protein
MPIKVLSCKEKLSRFTFLLPLFAALVYLFLSPVIYPLFVRVEEGKPIKLKKDLRTNTDKILFNIDDLKYWVGGGEVEKEARTYALWGWAFIDDKSLWEEHNYDRQVLLTDGKTVLQFETIIYYRDGVKKHFADKNIKNLDKAGFYAVMDRSFIPVGVYKVFLRFKDQQSTQEMIVRTPITLRITPNHVFFSNTGY